MTLNEKQVERFTKDMKEIKEALLGNPYHAENKGLVCQVEENKTDIKQLKKSRWKTNLAFVSLGGASGAGFSSKLSTLLAKIIALFGS